MDDSCETQRQEELKMVSSDSAYGSSAEDGLTPNTFPYNEDLMHKVITFILLLMRTVKYKINRLSSNFTNHIFFSLSVFFVYLLLLIKFTKS